MSDSLRVALVDGAMYTPLYDSLDQFSRQTGPGVEVVEQLELPELMQHVAPALRNGAPYDLVCAHSQYTASLADDLHPLEALIPAPLIRDLGERWRGLCTWEGQLVQAPRSVETRLLFYRSDLYEDDREREWFAQASGGRELRVPQSWEEL